MQTFVLGGERKAVPVIAAKLGWGTEPITVVEWKAREGDQVEKGSPILVVSTVKITAEIEAEASGYLHILFDEGTEAPVGSVAGLIAATKEELQALQKEKPPKELVTKPVESKEAPPVEAAPVKPVAETTEGERILISPVARKMAQEHMIDITSVVGTGPGGRIVREDLEKAIAARKETAPPPAPAVYEGKQVKSTIPLKGMRKVIAEHMHRSLSLSAQLTVMGEIDATELVKLREALVAQADTIGTRISYTDMFVFAVAKLLKTNPIINSSLIDNEIKLWQNINIGVAVALEEGLIVPVVKDTDKKSLAEINQTVKTLAEKARDGKLVPDDVSGGTFTITNLGALGGGYRFETVVINQPESAILGTGGITDRAVVRNGQIVIRPILTYYLTYDHRVIMGAQAAKFVADLTRLLENPALLLV